MPKYILSILDTTGIQNYIFGSNRLKENIGASELVKRATENWVYDAMPASHNVKPDGQMDDNQHIEDGQLQSEVIYAGGGNAVILFADISLAGAFAAKISKKLIMFAPGINFTIVHTEFDWAADALGGDKSGVVFKTFAKLADAKQCQPASRPLTGLSASAFCQSTGLPAIDTHLDKKGNKPRLVSAETKAKLEAFDKLADHKLIGNLSDSGYEMERDFNELGEKEREGKGSYIAVVHADGNGMGQRVQEIAKKFPHPGKGNRDYINASRKFSHDMSRATAKAVEVMETQLLVTVPDKYPAMITDKKLPYRRIIVGGDDITFVCDGRLGLTLTAAFLNAFEQAMTASSNEHLKDVRIASGIAVVKTHYPFIRAYELAESLTANAKRWVKDKKAKGSVDFSAMDWHFAPGGLAGDLDFIREREYRIDKDHTLLMRPIALHPEPGWRNWDNFSYIVEQFKDIGEEGWGNKRNKVKAFREALRKGQSGVKQFLTAYKGKEDERNVLPEIKTGDPAIDVRVTGWSGEHCAYFDAIEAMDFHLSLTAKGDGDV